MFAEGQPDGGRRSFAPIIKTQGRKCGVLLVRVQTKNAEKKGKKSLLGRKEECMKEVDFELDLEGQVE